MKKQPDKKVKAKKLPLNKEAPDKELTDKELDKVAGGYVDEGGTLHKNQGRG